MDLTVIGTRTTGLVAGSCFADTGHDVTCVDPDEERILRLSSGAVPGTEPGLDELITRNVEAGRLRFSSDVRAGIRSGNVIFIATGGPDGEAEEEGDGDPAGLEEVLQVARTIGRHANGEKVVVALSGLPVGTARQIRAVIEERTSHPVYVCASPGPITAGAAVDDFLHPDRVVLGVQNERARRVLRELYRPFLGADTPLVFMDLPSAEFSTYAADGRLGSRLGFMNLVTRLGAGARKGGGKATAGPSEAGPAAHHLRVIPGREGAS